MLKLPKLLEAAAVLFLAAIAPGTAFASPYPNVRVNINSNHPEETSIAINPHDPTNVVAVAQGSDCFFYPSFDFGHTWTEGSLTDLYCLGDPSVVFDRTGNGYYCYIGTWSHSGIFVNRTTDGGITWKPTGTAVVEHEGEIPFEDKPYPVADWTGGPRRGYLYVSWTRFTHYGSTSPSDSSWILFARSTDQAESFQPPVRVSDRGGDAVDSDNTLEGAVPAVGPEGNVYIAWAGPRGIEFDRSTDGGRTFGRDQVISDMPGGWDLAIQGIYRCNGLPVTKTDLSFGPHRGRVYVNWSDQRNGDTDVFLIYSDDGGLTWSSRIRVNDDPVGNGRDQFFSWMDVDAVTGSVYIDFYDRREHADNLTTDVYLAYSDDGGDHFTNVKVSATSFVPRSDIFFGDYTGISAFAGRVRPFWMRLDGTTLSVWTALVDRPTADVPAGDGSRGSIAVFPNPVHRTGAEIIYSAPIGAPGIALLRIHDASGRRVRTLQVRSGIPATWDGRDDDGREAPAGVYFVSGEKTESARIVLLR